jgi:hypothetical protein
MKASDEITEEQSRQVSPTSPSSSCLLYGSDLQMLFDIEHAYSEFFRSLSSSGKSS